MTRILHVDDSWKWRDRVLRALTAEGYEVFSFVTLIEAQTAAQEFDIFICDGTVSELNDGANWAYELQEAGSTVIIFSTMPVGDPIPYVNKSEYQWPRRVEDLVLLVKELIDASP